MKEPDNYCYTWISNYTSVTFISYTPFSAVFAVVWITQLFQSLMLHIPSLFWPRDPCFQDKDSIGVHLTELICSIECENKFCWYNFLPQIKQAATFKHCIFWNSVVKTFSLCCTIWKYHGIWTRKISRIA